MTAGIVVQSQYLRDLSFELVKAPWEAKMDESEIELNTDVSVSTKKFEKLDLFEVSIKLKLRVVHLTVTLFILEIEYSGIFALSGIDEGAIQKILMVDCAYLLFPYIRHIITVITQDSGFRTLSLNPVNFHDLYAKHLKDNSINKNQ